MSFKPEDCDILRKNPHAKDCAEFLCNEVYPSIIVNMKNIGRLQYTFELGKDNSNFGRYRMRLSLLDGRDDALNIELIMYYVSVSDKKENILRTNSYTVDNNNECYYFDETTGLTMHSSQVEPIFQSIVFLDIEQSVFLTATHFYLFYCEKIMNIAEELNKTYRDGFDSIVGRAKKIIIPIKRIVLIEKFKG